MPTPDEVTEALKDVLDPEIGIGLVDLGLSAVLASNAKATRTSTSPSR